MSDSTLTARANAAFDAEAGAIRRTLADLTPRQIDDIRSMARMVYFQGRIDALEDAKTDRRLVANTMPPRELPEH